MDQQPDQQADQPNSEPASTGLTTESAGGAGMMDEDAPIGFTAEVGGAGAGSTDDPEELRQDGLAASARGPMHTSEREERGEGEDDRPWVG
jgi:hypothetical protein